MHIHAHKRPYTHAYTYTPPHIPALPNHRAIVQEDDAVNCASDRGVLVRDHHVA
jgi:hypothetical protein